MYVERVGALCVSRHPDRALYDPPVHPDHYHIWRAQCQDARGGFARARGVWDGDKYLLFNKVLALQWEKFLPPPAGEGLTYFS